MKKVGKRLSKGFDKILTGTAYISGIIIVILMLSMSYEVVMRYFFKEPTKWAVDFAGYMQYACVLLGSAWVLKIGSHTRIDVLTNRFQPRTQTILNIVTSSISLLACIAFLWKGFEATWDAYQSGDFLYREVEVPLSILYAFIPFAFLLICIQFGREIHKHWHNLKRPTV